MSVASFRRVGRLYVPRGLEASGYRLTGLPENIDARLFATEHDAAIAVSAYIRAHVDVAALRSEMLRLGLQTGNTPIPAFRALWGSDWSNVSTWNLDEFFPMRADDPKSYHRYMWENLFSHVKINPANVHIPCGDPDLVDPHVESERYEASIRDVGDMDLWLVGLGRNGHVGFNEPGSSFESTTRLVPLAKETFDDAQLDFRGRVQPTQAITVGLGTAMRAREVAMVVTGPKTTEILPRVFLDSPTTDVPASVLQAHGKVRLFADRVAAAGLLKRLSERR
ncbi:MAG: glucosamine-6-phosphate deaminase [Myxococcaceae bacterium]